MGKSKNSRKSTSRKAGMLCVIVEASMLIKWMFALRQLFKYDHLNLKATWMRAIFEWTLRLVLAVSTLGRDVWTKIIVFFSMFSDFCNMHVTQVSLNKNRILYLLVNQHSVNMNKAEALSVHMVAERTWFTVSIKWCFLCGIYWF
jgi:hypothetical protein